MKIDERLFEKFNNQYYDGNYDIYDKNIVYYFINKIFKIFFIQKIKIQVKHQGRFCTSRRLGNHAF